MKHTALLAALILAACSPQAKDDGKNADETSAAVAVITPVETAAPSGDYILDLAHASVNFRVNHLGLSRYTARFTRFDGRLHLDTEHPAASTVVVNIDATSLQTNFPAPDQIDFDKEIQNETWLNTALYSRITFSSGKVTLTGPNTARISGDLFLHGVTHPVELDATFNGGMAAGTDPTGAPMAPRIGFSAHGSLKRSDFGILAGLPAAGTTMGVGDDVEIIIEAEFTQPLK